MASVAATTAGMKADSLAPEPLLYVSFAAQMLPVHAPRAPRLAANPHEAWTGPTKIPKTMPAESVDGIN